MGYVYILASQKNGTLYVGVTSNIAARMYSHKQKYSEGFTKRYDVLMLVYSEEYPSMEEAIKREKQLKAWRRQWKIDLVEKHNPNWQDLYEVLN